MWRRKKKGKTVNIKAIERKSYRGGTEVVIQELQRPNAQAGLAASFCEKWGLVMGEPDGEDSAGRQRLRLMSVENVVERACAMASLLWEEFERRGWLLEVPIPKEPEDLENLGARR